MRRLETSHYENDLLTLIPVVLRRARPETEEKERKTASGRTFRVQG